MDAFEVIQPGPFTTVQDSGRYGYQRYGVPPSGAFDNYAYRTGNLLVGNEEKAASLEITLSGCQLRILGDRVVAITGADLMPTLNDDTLPMWKSISISYGDIISFRRLKSGCRAYLAITGGISVPQVMSSASTYARAGIGGFEGRQLRKGDILQAAEAPPIAAGGQIPHRYIPQYSPQIELRVIPGPQDNHFTENGIRTFLESTYIVSTRADRMGYRLDGPRIQHRLKADIISDGVPLGAVQVPDDGLPIILLADRGTTGGYTKIATVISPDIPKVAQAKPGDEIKFRQVMESEAEIALEEYERNIRAIRQLLRDNEN